MSPASQPCAEAVPGCGRGPLRRLLEAAFVLTNGARLLAYLPTLWAIHASGSSSQHSLWTWGIWLASNATMAWWLYDRQGGRTHRAALVSVGNSLMCLAAVCLIVWNRP